MNKMTRAQYAPQTIRPNFINRLKSRYLNPFWTISQTQFKNNSLLPNSLGIRLALSVQLRVTIFRF